MSTDMQDPRWTAETETLATTALSGAVARGADSNREVARAVLAALADAGLLLPPGVIRRHERGYVYQDGHRLSIGAERTIWETPWLPEKIADWERELLEQQAADTNRSAP